MGSSLRIVVAGLVGRHPLGGVAFDYLQTMVGLADLGHDVYYHEDTWSWPDDPVARTPTESSSYTSGFLTDFFERWAPELRDRWHYVHLHDTHHGMSREDFAAVARTADLFINVSGASTLPDELGGACLKVFLDTDPGYNQIVMATRPSWSPNVDRWVESIEKHDRHATYAEGIGAPDCGIPETGLDWIPTRPPVVERWWTDLRGTLPVDNRVWSTVMTWNGFGGPLLLDDTEFGSKGTEFERLISLPSITSEALLVAVGGREPPIERIRNHGWQVVDAPAATLSTDDYRSFIGRSFGEFSVAKNVYVALRTGWFSCRTACYLAAGRPAVVQDTGFSSVLPTGAGLLAFDDLEEAAEQLLQVASEPRHHARAAAAIARDHLSADRVLGRLLDDLS